MQLIIVFIIHNALLAQDTLSSQKSNRSAAGFSSLFRLHLLFSRWLYFEDHDFSLDEVVVFLWTARF